MDKSHGSQATYHRLLFPEDHWNYQRLVELTKDLEDRKMFDEIFVARVTVMTSFYVMSRMIYSGDEQAQMEWLTKANELMNELNSVPLAAA